MDDKGAVVLGFDPEDALPALAELESQVVEIQFIIHLLGPDCQDLQPGEFLRVGRPDPEVGRDEDLLLDFFGGSLCRVITYDYAVASHIGTDPMDPADLFHPGLEGHGTAVALDGFEVFNLNRLQFHPFRNVPALVNCRELKLRPEDKAEGNKNDGKEGREVFCPAGSPFGRAFFPEGNADGVART